MTRTREEFIILSKKYLKDYCKINALCVINTNVIRIKGDVSQVRKRHTTIPIFNFANTMVLLFLVFLKKMKPNNSKKCKKNMKKHNFL